MLYRQIQTRAEGEVCLIQHGRECCKWLKNSSSYEPTSEKSLEINEVYAEKIKVKFMRINRILCHSIQTLIKNVFLLNFAHELLMSFLNTLKNYSDFIQCIV